MKKILSQGFLLLLLVAGLAGIAFGAGPQTGGWGFGGNPPAGGYIPAFFQAFSSNGRGTYGPCSTTAPTGYKGQTLTFTRASSGTCTKTNTGGLATTGIANGDLVVLSTNQARVEYDSAGTLGLLVEATRTNSTLRNQAFENAAWAAYDYNGATIAQKGSADTDASPTGATDAERITFNIATAGQASAVYQSLGCPVGVAATASLYVKGATTSGDVDICMLTAAGAYTCAPCTFVSGSWSRCSVSGTTSGASVFLFGHNGTASGTITGSGRAFASAQTIIASLAQCENGSSPTSVIPTTTIAVARAAEGTISFPASMAAGYGSMAVSVTLNHAPSVTIGFISDNAITTFLADLVGNLPRLYVASTLKATSAAVPAAGTSRMYGWWSAAGSEVSWGGTAATGTTQTSGAFTSIQLGPIVSSVKPDAILSRICLDPSPERCR